MREGLGIRLPAPGDQSWQTQYALNGYLMMDIRCNKQIPAAMWRKDCSRQTRGRRATEDATAVFLPADETKVGGPKQRSLTLVTGRMPVSFLRRKRFGKESEKRTSRKALTEPIKKSPNVQSPPCPAALSQKSANKRAVFPRGHSNCLPEGKCRFWNPLIPIMAD